MLKSRWRRTPTAPEIGAPLRTLRRAGFNRISLGMQSSIEGELRAVGRIHTFEQVRAAVDAARKAKFKT